MASVFLHHKSKYDTLFILALERIMRKNHEKKSPDHVKDEPLDWLINIENLDET